MMMLFVRARDECTRGCDTTNAFLQRVSRANGCNGCPWLWSASLVCFPLPQLCCAGHGQHHVSFFTVSCIRLILLLDGQQHYNMK